MCLSPQHCFVFLTIVDALFNGNSTSKWSRNVLVTLRLPRGRQDCCVFLSCVKRMWGPADTVFVCWSGTAANDEAMFHGNEPKLVYTTWSWDKRKLKTLQSKLNVTLSAPVFTWTDELEDSQQSPSSLHEVYHLKINKWHCLFGIWRKSMNEIKRKTYTSNPHQWVGGGVC